MSDAAALLAQLDALQLRFLAAVNGGDWPGAQDLEKERFAIIDQLLGEARNAEITGALKAIVANDIEMLPRVEQALADTAAQLRELRKGRSAARAYENEAGPP